MAQSTEITSLFIRLYIPFWIIFVHLNLLGYLYYDETYDSYTISFSVFVVPRTIVQILHNRQGTFQQSDQQNIFRTGTAWYGLPPKTDWTAMTEPSSSPTSMTRKTSTLCHNYVRVLYEDSKGRLFVGTYNGIQLYDPETDSFSARAQWEDGKTLTAISCPFWNVGTEKYGYRETTCVP